jgi:DNA replicative helicase MCM subunit Mcm2 (Cdc46/Mcm family)
MIYTPVTSQAHGYREKIQRLLKTNSLRLTVNINHLRIFNREYAQGLLSSPVDYLPACDKALNDTLHTLDPDYAPASIGLDGSFGLNAVRDLHLLIHILGQSSQTFSRATRKDGFSSRNRNPMLPRSSKSCQECTLLPGNGHVPFA